MGRDFIYALRGLRRNIGFTLAAAITLALGIGLNTAIFSVMYGVLLAPLPFHDAARIVSVGTHFKDKARTIPRLTGGDLTDIIHDNRVFEAISVYTGGEIGVQLGDRATFTGTWFVRPEFFGVFGIQPVAGRLFGASDKALLAEVSEGFAKRNFGSASAAVNKAITIENRLYQISGVLPAGFAYPRNAEVWVASPVQLENLNRSAYNYAAVAKLKPGISRDGAQAEMETVGARLASAFPADNKAKTFAVTGLREQITGSIRLTLFFLLGAVTLVLLIACANVANLMLARAAPRAREFAVRAALGAARSRLVRQLAIEGLTLGLLGGALGIVLAQAGIDLLIRFAPANLPRANEVHLSVPVLLFAIAISLFSSLLFSLVPAWNAARADVNEALKQGGVRGVVGGQSGWLRSAVVVTEISLSIILAIGAGLLFRSFWALTQAPLGYRTDHILVMYAHEPANGLDQSLRAIKTVSDLYPKLAAIPGVVSVSAAMGLPTGTYGSNGMYAVRGKNTFAPGQDLPQAGFRLANPNYFGTMGIQVMRGRDFADTDVYDKPFVAVISESLARQSFAGEDPVGKQLQCGLDSLNYMTIVGVVGDVRQDSPASTPAPELYMPLAQHPFYANEVQVVMRTSVEPSALMDPVRRTVAENNPTMATKFTTMDAMVSNSIATPRFRTYLAGIFAGLAMLMAMSGIYGLMSYMAAQRTSEFGLRMALGAQRGDVMRLILRQTAGVTAIGIAVGLAASLLSTRVLSSILFGVQALDATTYIAVLVTILVVALAAAAFPAWRATRVDPVKALRQE